LQTDICLLIQGGSHYIAFVSTDHDLIHKVSRILGSKQKILRQKYENVKGKPRYRLQIASKILFEDLLKNLQIYAGIKGGSLYKKERKYNKFQEALNYYAGVA
jgi:hypothetical protein